MHKRLKTLLFTLVLALLAESSYHVSRATAIDYCTSDECKAAAAAETAAREKADAASAEANNLEAMVASLELEIAALEAKIAANEAAAADLAENIEYTENKLAAQKAALAALLVDIHFEEDPNTIMLLAGSSSISDLAEKQSRADSVKQQITLSALNIKKAKQELEDQKAEVDRLLVDQNNQRTVVAEKRAEQNNLMLTYRDNAEAYTAEAEEARKAKELAIANEIARLNSSGVAASGSNTYPFQSDCPQKNLWYGNQWGYVCQCTSYAGYKAYEHWGVDIAYWGNAYSWDEAAVARGYTVDYTPAPFTVAVSNSGEWGHVMWVESVNADGTINLSEYNNSYSSASGLPGDFGYRSGVSPLGLVFIHFN